MAMVAFNVAMIMTAGYTLFKKRASHPDTHDSGPAKTYVNYCLVRRKPCKLLKDTKAVHEDRLKGDIRSYINKYRASDQKNVSVEVYWKVLKGASGLQK